MISDQNFSISIFFIGPGPVATGGLQLSAELDAESRSNIRSCEMGGEGREGADANSIKSRFLLLLTYHGTMENLSLQETHTG